MATLIRRYRLPAALVALIVATVFGAVALSHTHSAAADGGTITGTVKDQNGSAVAGARVGANSPNGHFEGVTDSSGFFSFSVTSNGTYQVNPFPDFGTAPTWAYSKPPSPVDCCASGSATVNFVVTTTDASIVVNLVKAGAAYTLSQGFANASGGPGEFFGAPVNNASTVTIPVKAGTYFVNIFSGGPSAPANIFFDSQSVTVSSGGSATVTLTAKDRTAKIQGTVKDVNGLPVAGVKMSAFCFVGEPGPGGPGPGGPPAETTTGADGTYTIFVSTGRCNVNVQQNFGPGDPNQPPQPNYVEVSQQPHDVTIASEADVVTGVNFTVAKADFTINGKVVDASGAPVFLPGCAYARLASETKGDFEGNRELGCFPVMPPDATFSIKVASAGLTTVMVGMHTPPGPGVPGTVKDEQAVTVVPNGSASVTLTLVKNDATISGQLTSSGFPVSSCTVNQDKFGGFFGEVFANNFETRTWYSTPIGPDCKYTLSLLSGAYHIGARFNGEAGFPNIPPTPDPVTITSGQTLQYNLSVEKADASISGTLKDADGNPIRNGFAFADNNQMINDLQDTAGRGQPGGPGGPGSPGGPQGPGGDDELFKKIFEACGKDVNSAACKKFDSFKLPFPGPDGKCKTARACFIYCKSNANKCGDIGDKGREQGTFQKSPTGAPPAGPGGCTSPESCQKYCTEHASDPGCQKPPEGQPSGSFGYTKLKLVKGTSKLKDERDFRSNSKHFDTMTDQNGKFSIKVVSGNVYMVGAGVPPGQNYGMPPRMEQVDLTTAKSATVSLQFQKAFGVLTATVKKTDGSAASIGFCHGWSESGQNTGGPVQSGVATLSYTDKTTWHVGCDSREGTTFLRSDEQVLVVDGQKTLNGTFVLEESKCIAPPAVTKSVDSSSATTISTPGATITVPAGALASSGTVTVTVSPDTDQSATKSAQPLCSGIKIEAVDSTGKDISTLQSDITIELPVPEEETSKVDESAISGGSYSDTSGTWDKADDASFDSGEDTVSFTTDHLSTYSVLNTSGKAIGKGVKSIKTSTSAGKTKVTIGTGTSKKSITPFNEKVDVSVATASIDGKQVIIAVPSGTTKAVSKVKIYSSAGKLLKQLTPIGGYKGGFTLVFDDVTKDTKEDIVLAPLTGDAMVKVYDVSKKYKGYTIDLAGTGKTLVAAYDLFITGIGNLTTVAPGTTTVKVYKFQSGKFVKASAPKSVVLKVKSGAISKTKKK